MRTRITTAELARIAAAQRIARRRRNISAMHRIGRNLRGV